MLTCAGGQRKDFERKQRFQSNNLVFYHHTIPIIFTEELPFTYKKLRFNTFKAFPEGTFNNSVWQSEAIKYIRELFCKQRNVIIHEFNITIPSHQRKRAIPIIGTFLGNFYSWAFGLTTEEEFKDVKENQQDMIQELNKIREVTVSEHQHLLDFNTALQRVINLTQTEVGEIKQLLTLRDAVEYTRMINEACSGLPLRLLYTLLILCLLVLR